MSPLNHQTFPWTGADGTYVEMLRLQGAYTLSIQTAEGAHLSLGRFSAADMLAVSLLIAGLDTQAETVSMDPPHVLLKGRRSQVELSLFIRPDEGERTYDVDFADASLSVQFRMSERLLKDFGKWLGEIVTDPANKD